MKSKKALKRLTRVEALLSDVLDQYAGVDDDFRESLNSARISVNGAREAISHQVSRVAVKNQKAVPKPSQKFVAIEKQKVSSDSRKSPVQAENASNQKPGSPTAKKQAVQTPGNRRKASSATRAPSARPRKPNTEE